MSKKEFIYHLVSEGFASQFEAEQYNYPAGSNEWVYNNPFTKIKAHTNSEGICVYQYEVDTDSWYSHQIFCNQAKAA